MHLHTYFICGIDKIDRTNERSSDSFKRSKFIRQFINAEKLFASLCKDWENIMMLS